MYAIGQEHLKVNKKDCRDKISQHLIGENTLDGSSIQENWFNTFKVDVFISHSHTDERLANILAGYLHCKYLLNCFIDSNIWGCFEDLVDNITYFYRNDDHNKNIRLHVHTMLQIALQEMMDKSETVIFLNTENSMTNLTNQLSNHNYTLSPWIYHELVVSRLIEKKLPVRTGLANESHFSLDSVRIAYNPPIDHLTKLCSNDLNNLSKDTNVYPLDALYKKKGLMK